MPASGWSGEWKRIITSPKGGGVDSPRTHNLNYFTDFPDALDYDDDFCYLCGPQERAAKLVAIFNSKDKLRAEVHLVGTVQGFEVSDILYYRGAVDPKAWGWRRFGS